MSNERWQEVWEIFERALDLPEEERPSFVEQACGSDEGLRQSVEELLVADQQADSPIDHPAAHLGEDADKRHLDSTVDHLPSQRRGSADALAHGTRIGAYRILRRVGQGGMSTVYLAVRADDAFKRRVVVKLVRPGMESEAILERLRTERQILASLDHPHIAKLHDGGTTESQLPYFVMEYIEGLPIDTFCDQNQLTVDERLTLFGKVCAAVHYAHQNLVVHRDLKPSNILVTADGSPKLLDFGIAKLLNPDLASAGHEPTATWHRLLTPNYASPEQVRGKMITTASDVYSLGVLLYKLLTGRLPHQLSGRSPHEIEGILSTSEPVAPSQVARRKEPQSTVKSESPGEPISGRLEKDLDAIVLKSLRSAPIKRYLSVEQMAADIERFQSGLPVEAWAGTWSYRAGKFLRRNRKAAALALGGLLLLIGFAVAMTLQASRVAFERDQARQERDKKSEVLALVLDLFKHSSPYVIPGRELTVREALERSVPVLEDSLAEQPEVRAELLHTSGSILSVLGAYEAAEGQLTEALELRRELYGETHSDFVDTLTALAGIYREKGDLDQAESLARQAVATAETLGTGARFRSGPLNELVSVMCYRSEFGAAEGPARQALELARKLPERSTKKIVALEQLARIRNSQGRYREGAQLNREALALYRARYGETHPYNIGTLNNIGLSLRRMDELDAAEQTFREALELQRRNFGEEHKNHYLLNNLAGVLSARGEYVQAEALYQEALAHVLDNQGPEHWLNYLFALRTAMTRIGQGLAAESEVALRRLLAEWEPRLGDHWRLDEGRSVLGSALQAQGRCTEARPFLVGGFESLLGHANDRTRRDAFARLETHLRDCGNGQEIPHFRKMLEDS